MILHKHHIIPRHMGGTDDPDNLVEITPGEHADAHLKLYEEFGKKEDLTAYYLLSGHLKEGFEERARLGGKIQGKRNADSGHIQSIARAQSSEDHSVNGKKGAEVCRRKGVNAFFDPELRKEISSAGGKIQGKKTPNLDISRASVPSIGRMSKLVRLVERRKFGITQTPSDAAFL